MMMPSQGAYSMASPPPGAIIVDAQGREIGRVPASGGWPPSSQPARTAVAAAPAARPVVARGKVDETPPVKPAPPPPLPTADSLGVGQSPKPFQLPPPEALGIAPRG
jgi:hypothetical protein